MARRRREGHGLVRRGGRLAMARERAQQPDVGSALAPAKDFLAACRKQELAGRRRVQLAKGAITLLIIGVIVLTPTRLYAPWFNRQWMGLTTFRGHGLSEDALRKLRPGDSFAECA